MIKDAPITLKLLLLVLMCGMCALVLVGLLGHEPFAFNLAVVDMILFGGILTVWRMRKGKD
jgi:hypothetical protein